MNGADATTAAVEAFVDDVTVALRTVTDRLGRTVPDRSREDVVNEAFNLVCAFIDADGRHSDDELWVLSQTFGPMMGDVQLSGATPSDLRGSSIVSGKGVWLSTPSTLFDILVSAEDDRSLAWTYYSRAMDLLHVLASLDAITTQAELDAIAGYRDVLIGRIRATTDEQAVHPVPPDSALGQPSQTEPAPEDEPKVPIEDLLAELDDLVGLVEVKARVKQLADLLRIQQLRRERELPTVDTSQHLVFVGNPGTGKTTVARLLAKIFRSLGVLERGHLVETDRSGLVAGFVGQTAPLVAKRFAEADGGMLFIDEAYTLVRGGENDFGREAIDAVVKLMEDHRDDIALVVAGYPDEMAAFLDANPGLRSRFPTTIVFPDYGTDDLVTIFCSISEAKRYHLDEAGLAELRRIFDDEPRTKGFGNGRFARNLFEAAVSRQASRLAAVAAPTDEELVSLVAADLRERGGGAVKRLLALLLAVGLVGGAWYLRTNVIDDDGGDGGSGGPSSSGTPTLICATEVRAACDELDDVEVEVEDPGATYDRLVAGEDLGADGWLVSQPWPDMTEELGFSAGATSDVLARSPMVVVARANGPGRPQCPTELSWACVATFAEGSSNFAYGSKDTTGGLLARHGIAAGLIGRTDYASNDFEFTDDFPAKYAGIESGAADAIQGRGPELAADIQRFQGAYAAVAVLGSAARDLDEDRFDADAPTPEITADVVLAGRPDRFDTDDIRDALFTTGWLRSRDKALSATNGLPNPGVMVALRELSR